MTDGLYDVQTHTIPRITCPSTLPCGRDELSLSLSGPQSPDGEESMCRNSLPRVRVYPPSEVDTRSSCLRCERRVECLDGGLCCPPRQWYHRDRVHRCLFTNRGPRPGRDRSVGGDSPRGPEISTRLPGLPTGLLSTSVFRPSILPPQGPEESRETCLTVPAGPSL